MEEIIRLAITEVATEYSSQPIEIELSSPDPVFGDYATNIALKLAKATGQNPRQLATVLVDSIRQRLDSILEAVDIAGPGFINLRLNQDSLIKLLNEQPLPLLEGQIIVFEFSDPNPFKLLHAGHLYTSIVGDSMANLLTQAGAKVYRVNYGGDVGLHVAKSLWAMIKELGGEWPDKLQAIDPAQRSQWMSQVYVAGSKAYESDETAKIEITALNKKVYAIQATQDKASSLAKIYWTTRQWSYDAFDKFYARLNIGFDKYYPESQATPIGLDTVETQLAAGVFEPSEGAVVFRGEKYGLHTRVFINSQGLPTYEAKELGLAVLKKNDYNYDQSIIITGNEQQQYMTVVLKALEQFAPGLALTTTHLTHGMVKLSGGQKMSSRLGNFLTAESIIETTTQAALKINDQNDMRVVLAAIKYSMLKQRLGGDIIYEPEESVNLIGNSGPYLQYAHARARSIISKVNIANLPNDYSLTKDERLLALKLSRYASVINQACVELSPHSVCSYLYELAQVFNRFYESNRVIGDERESIRLYLVNLYATRLKTGLQLLGIEAPDRL